MDDTEAIEKTLHGDREAFGFLVSRYQAKVFAVALARVYDAHDAMDLSQEAFLRAYERLPMLRNTEAFGPWLFMILRRLCIDFLRGKWRHKHMRNRIGLIGPPNATTTNPGHGIDEADAIQTLWSRIAQLDVRSREVLSLHYGQGLKITEIAQLMGATESAVKMRLRRARAVLGERIGDLSGVWGVAPVPAFSAGIMKAVSATGSFKEGIAASSFLGGALAFPALVSLFWWCSLRDLKRWEMHAPTGLLGRNKRIMVRSILIVAIAILLAPVIAAAIALLIPLSFSPGDTLPHWVATGMTAVYFSLMIVMLGTIFKREIDLLAPREKLKQYMNVVAVGALSLVMLLAPAHASGALGVFLILQYFLVNKSNIALAAVPPGIWIASMLRPSSEVGTRTIPVTRMQIKSWLTLLHSHGLVAPPLKYDEQNVSVRLRLRASLFEKMTWRTYSTLLIATRGEVSCNLLPRDYVELAQHLELEVLPGRQELATRIANSFQRGLAAYAKGEGEAAVASALNLSDCPIDSSKSQGLRVNRYVLPLIGIGLVVHSVSRLFQ